MAPLGYGSWAFIVAPPGEPVTPVKCLLYLQGYTVINASTCRCRKKEGRKNRTAPSFHRQFFPCLDGALQYHLPKV